MILDNTNLSTGFSGLTMRGAILPLLFLCCVSGQREAAPNNFQLKLTSERGGPPSGAQFVPIPVVDIPPFTGTKPMSKRPKVGQPPPPPPPLSSLKPPRRPKPPSGGFVAPPPPAKPVPVDQGIPEASGGNKVPALPPDVTVVTPLTEVRPDKETVAPTDDRPTTTPRTRDHLPALYQRYLLNDDHSYYFDFEAPNSVARSEQGFFRRDAEFENPVHVKSGTYSFTSPEGVAFKVNYVADERGYRTFMTQV